MRGESLHLGNLMHVLFLLKSCEMGYNTFVNSLGCDTCTWFHFDTEEVAKLSWAATLQILGHGTSFHDAQYFLCTPGGLIYIYIKDLSMALYVKYTISPTTTLTFQKFGIKFNQSNYYFYHFFM